MTKYILALCLYLLISCTPDGQKVESSPDAEDSQKVSIIFDTDANNELDDQHALAYLLFSGNSFNVVGVTVNATYNGGDIEEHVAEARRVMQLCGVEKSIPLISGANGDFETIRKTIDEPVYDGKDAVQFIINESRKSRDQKLVLLPVGKLTNIALALEIAPDIKEKVRVVWLGSNYPEPGEYNQENDIPSLNYILDQDVPFEMVMVRYGKSTGSDVIRATRGEIEKEMKGMGPRTEPVMGRHGDAFTCFGDYSIDLFLHAQMHGEPPSRALFDMVAVAIVKEPSWGNSREIPAPILEEDKWIERSANSRKVILWENFKTDSILADFYHSMKYPSIAEQK